MPYFEIIWDEEPGGNVEHIAEHGITMDDGEEVLFNPPAEAPADRQDFQ
jgi:hypothetical protein